MLIKIYFTKYFIFFSCNLILNKNFEVISILYILHNFILRFELKKKIKFKIKIKFKKTIV